MAGSSGGDSIEGGSSAQHGDDTLHAGDEEGRQVDGGGATEGGQVDDDSHHANEVGGQAHGRDAAEGGHDDNDNQQDSDEDRQAGDEEGGQADGGGATEGGQAEQASDEEGGQAHHEDATEGGHSEDDNQQDSDEDRQGIRTPSSEEWFSSNASTLAHCCGPVNDADAYIALPPDLNLQGYTTYEDFGMGIALADFAKLKKLKSLEHLIPILHVQLGVGDRDQIERQAFLKMHQTCLDNLLADQELVGWKTSELSRLRRFTY
jgi:hypothetical protein